MSADEQSAKDESILYFVVFKQTAVAAHISPEEETLSSKQNCTTNAHFRLEKLFKHRNLVGINYI